MERVAIVERGPRSVGKSSTIKLVYAELCARYPDAAIRDLHTRPRKAADAYKDILIVVTIPGVKVGLLSQGDPEKVEVIRRALLDFVNVGCDVIVCASRDRGNTLEEVRRLAEDGYKVIERRRKGDTADVREAANRAEANWIIEQIASKVPVEATT